MMYFSIVKFSPQSELTGYKTALNYICEYINVYCCFILSVCILNIEENTKSIGHKNVEIDFAQTFQINHSLIIHD